MNYIQKRLFELKDDKYGDFQAKLTPTLDRNYFIGVKTPILRTLTKELGVDNKFLDSLPHKYFEENQIHSFMLANIKDYDEFIKRANDFLPFVNNWATCDQLNNKILKKHKVELLEEIKKWLKSKETYAIRFGVEMLMNHYLDEDDISEYSNMVAKVKSDEYYVNMMRAWYFASALAKHYEQTIIYIKEHKLDVWTHDKTIRKAIESYRISDKQKEELRKLSIK